MCVGFLLFCHALQRGCLLANLVWFVPCGYGVGSVGLSFLLVDPSSFTRMSTILFPRVGSNLLCSHFFCLV